MQKIIRAFLLNFSNENKLRAIFYFIFLFILCFIVSIALFDFVGLPDYLENILRQKLQERKISLHFENVKLGLVNGITLENIAFSHIINNQIKIDCKAEKVRISLDFFPEYKIKVSNIEVIDSLIDIFSMDLEPSSGISLKNLNASISLTDKDIEVIHLNGLCSEIPINIKGKVSNYSTLIENTNIKKIGNKAQIANNNSNINNDILLTRYIEIIKKIVNQNKKDSSINITANLDVKGPRLFFINVKLKTSSLKLENLSFEDVNMKNFLILNMEKASPDIQNTIYFSSKKARYLEFLLNKFFLYCENRKEQQCP